MSAMGVLQRETIAEYLGLAAREFDLGAVLTRDFQCAAEPWLDRLDEGGVDYLSAVCANKQCAWQPRFKRDKGPVKQRTKLLEMDARVIALGFQQANRAHRCEPAAIAIPHENIVGFAQRRAR